MPITNYYGKTALDAIISAGGAMTIALSSTLPELDNTATSGVIGVTEPTGGAYARVSMPAGNWVVDQATLTATYNANIVFPVATADWGTVGYFVVYSGTNAVLCDSLADEVNVTAGLDALRIPAGDLKFGLFQ